MAGAKSRTAGEIRSTGQGGESRAADWAGEGDGNGTRGEGTGLIWYACQKRLAPTDLHYALKVWC